MDTTAFTLIEILIVIAVIAVLAAILFPVFAKSRANARRTTCQSNLRQIGVAVSEYLQDYDGQHPPDTVETAGITAPGWAAFLLPYTKSPDLLHCPDQTETSLVALPGGFCDYGYNRNLLGLAERQIIAPTNTILVLDCVHGTTQNWDNGTDTTYFDCQGDSQNPKATPGAATWLTKEDYAKRHLGGANYLFADGHVKALQPLSIYNNCTSPTDSASATFAYR